MILMKNVLVMVEEQEFSMQMALQRYRWRVCLKNIIQNGAKNCCKAVFV